MPPVVLWRAVTRRQRLVNLAIAVAIAVVAAVVIIATSSEDEPEREGVTTPAPAASAGASVEPRETPTPEPTPEPPPAIEVKGGEVVGGVAELEFKEGDQIRFTVTSDVADHVHVHAYDLFKDLAPGQTVRFSFPATITGITEIELEDSGLQIAELRVEP